MAKEQDKIVSNILETFNYDKFSTVPENRGRRESKGINKRKVKALQDMITHGSWIPEMAMVYVNKKFEIVDGTNVFEVCKRNNLPVRYEIKNSSHVNEVGKRELVGVMYSINSTKTAWTAVELFNAALQLKCRLAIIMNEIILANDNYFLWTDLMALLERDSRYFIGRWRSTTLTTFTSQRLIGYIQTDEFKYELDHFTKLNLKARIAPKKGVVLKAAYDILWNAGDMIDKKLFRKSLRSLPENFVTSHKTAADEPCRKMLLFHYNKSQGQRVEPDAVLFALKHKDVEEPVLEI